MPRFLSRYARLKLATLAFPAGCGSIHRIKPSSKAKSPPGPSLINPAIKDGTGTAVVSMTLPTGTDATWAAASIGGTGTVPATPNSGLYFKGTNAVAANGGNLVPLFSPTTWSSGSSGAHMDDAFYIGGNKQLMNSATGNGPGIRTFSPLEVGIFKDIGYTTFGIPEPASTFLFGLGALVMFRRRRAAVL